MVCHQVFGLRWTQQSVHVWRITVNKFHRAFVLFCTPLSLDCVFLPDGIFSSSSQKSLPLSMVYSFGINRNKRIQAKWLSSKHHNVTLFSKSFFFSVLLIQRCSFADCYAFIVLSKFRLSTWKVLSKPSWLRFYLAVIVRFVCIFVWPMRLQNPNEPWSIYLFGNDFN